MCVSVFAGVAFDILGDLDFYLSTTKLLNLEQNRWGKGKKDFFLQIFIYSSICFLFILVVWQTMDGLKLNWNLIFDDEFVAISRTFYTSQISLNCFECGNQLIFIKQNLTVILWILTNKKLNRMNGRREGVGHGAGLVMNVVNVNNIQTHRQKWLCCRNAHWTLARFHLCRSAVARGCVSMSVLLCLCMNVCVRLSQCACLSYNITYTLYYQIYSRLRSMWKFFCFVFV